LTGGLRDLWEEAPRHYANTAASRTGDSRRRRVQMQPWPTEYQMMVTCEGRDMANALQAGLECLQGWARRWRTAPWSSRAGPSAADKSAEWRLKRTVPTRRRLGPSSRSGSLRLVPQIDPGPLLGAFGSILRTRWSGPRWPPSETPYRVCCIFISRVLIRRRDISYNHHVSARLISGHGDLDRDSRGARPGLVIGFAGPFSLSRVL